MKTTITPPADGGVLKRILRRESPAKRTLNADGTTYYDPTIFDDLSGMIWQKPKITYCAYGESGKRKR